jgi:phage-related protein
MAGIPKVKITFDADFDELKKGVKGAQKEVEGFSSKIGKFGKVAAAAFAAATVAAAAYAGKLLVDGVKSAIADAAAQEKLALTLKNVTGATNAQIKATEGYITQTSLAFGVTDDELRPSLERLARATGDVEKAQRLQALALDISAGSGKSLEAVSNALGKATEGNTAALGKLGVGLSSAQLKTLSMDEITKKLADTFENQASAKAETFQGKLDRLNIAFEEGKETVGSFVLDALTPLVSSFVNKVIPALASMADSIGKDLQGPFNNIKVVLNDFVIPAFKALYDFMKNFVAPFFASVFGPALDGLFSAFNKVRNSINGNADDLAPLFSLFKSVATFVRDTMGPAIGTVLRVAFEVLGTAISAIVSGLSRMVNFLSDAIQLVKDFIRLVADNPLVRGIGDLIDRIFGGGRAMGGPVTSGTSYIVGEQGPELFTPSRSGTIIPNHALGGGGRGSVINLTVNGAIDPEGTARAIINVLNNSSYRGTLGSGAFA